MLYFLPLPILDDERGVDRQSLYQELFDVLVELFPSPTLAIGCRKNEREALAMSSFPSSITHTTKCTTVVDLLDLFHAAASCASLNEYFGCYYSSSCRFLGTDATENWNIPEFYGYSKPHFDAGSAWTYVPRPSSRRIEELAIGGADIQRIATFDELLDSESFVCTTRGSGSAVFDGGFWYILSYHLSFPTPNDLAENICAKIATYEKKSNTTTALSAASKKADEAAAQLLAELDMEDETTTTNNKKETGKTKKKTGKGKG